MTEPTIKARLVLDTGGTNNLTGGFANNNASSNSGFLSQISSRVTIPITDVLSGIYKGVKKLGDISPRLGAELTRLGVGLKMMLMPIGDIMANWLRPFIIKFFKVGFTFYQSFREWMKDIKEKGLIGATTDAVSGYVDSVKEAFKEGGINDGISKLSNDLKSFGTGLLGLGGLAGGGILLGNLLSGGGGLIGKIAGKLGKGFKAHAGKLAVMAGLLIGLPMLGEALMGEGGTLLGAIAGALGVGFTVLGGSMIGIAAGLTMVGGAALGKAMTGDNEGGLIGLIASAVGLGTVLVAGGGLALAIPVALTSVVIGAGMKNAVDQLVEDTGGVHNPPVPVEEVNKWARSSIYGEDNARSTTTPVMSDMLNSSILSVSAYDSGEAVSKRMAEGFSTNFPAQWAEISKLVDEHMSLTEPLTKLNTEAKNALVEGEDSFKGSVEKATESTLVMKEGLVSAPVEFRRLGHDAFYGPQGFISQGIDPATRKVNSLINMMNTTIVTRWRIEKEVVDVSD